MECGLNRVHLCPTRSGAQRTEVNDYVFDRLNRLDAYLDPQLVPINDFRCIVGIIANDLESIQPTSVHQVLEERCDCLDILLADCLCMWLIEELS